MLLADMNECERDVIRQCLRATVEGPFFPEWEFITLFGLERTKVEQILESWPPPNESAEDVQLAIKNSLRNLLGYPHRCEDEWSKFIFVSVDEVRRILEVFRRGGRDAQNQVALD